MKARHDLATRRIKRVKGSYILTAYDEKGNRLLGKKLKRLSSADLKRFKKIGQAECESIGSCFFIVDKHVKDFPRRVTGYSTYKPTRKGYRIGVLFYENL